MWVSGALRYIYIHTYGCGTLADRLASTFSGDSIQFNSKLPAGGKGAANVELARIERAGSAEGRVVFLAGPGSYMLTWSSGRPWDL